SPRPTGLPSCDRSCAATAPCGGVSSPPREKVAAPYDLPYLAAHRLDELKAVVSQALATPGPVLCEIFTPSTQEIIPTVSSYKREDGTMESRPLHDMYPFMDPETLRRYML